MKTEKKTITEMAIVEAPSPHKKKKKGTKVKERQHESGNGRSP